MKGNSYYIINNAIDIDKFKFNNKKRKIMRKELKIMDNEILIGHIGRFIKQKNHNFIIEVLKDLVLYDKNFKLLLVGVGNLKTMIEEKVKINKLENNVIFLGQRGDVNKIYQAMDIFLLPSLYEGLPLVGIEAQIAGCKCFFSNKITKDVRIKDDTEFLKISNSKEWAEKIVDYVKKEKNREESYCKEYDIRKSAEKLCRLYKSCMERK